MKCSNYFDGASANALGVLYRVQKGFAQQTPSPIRYPLLSSNSNASTGEEYLHPLLSVNVSPHLLVAWRHWRLRGCYRIQHPS